MRSSWIYLEKLAALRHSGRMQDQPVQRSFPRSTPKEHRQQTAAGCELYCCTGEADVPEPAAQACLGQAMVIADI